MLASSPVAVTLPAVDIDRAKKFYTEVLGLKIIDLEEYEGVALFEAGKGTQIMFYEREGTKAEHTAATFAVEDIEAVVDGLTEKGVVFEQYDMDEIKTDARGIATIETAKAAWFTDTEGNIIAIMSM
jgi:predicted enzyme related to lactoylglutathione lyase